MYAIIRIEDGELVEVNQYLDSDDWEYARKDFEVSEKYVLVETQIIGLAVYELRADR